MNKKHNQNKNKMKIIKRFKIQKKYLRKKETNLMKQQNNLKNYKMSLIN